MPRVEVNFDVVPDSVPPIEPGEYDMEVKECNVAENKNKNGFNLVAVLSISGPSGSPMIGRQVTDYMAISNDPNKNVRIKHFGQSAGLKMTSEGFDTEEAIGKTVRAQLVQNPGKTKDGKDTMFTNVRDYIVPVSA